MTRRNKRRFKITIAIITALTAIILAALGTCDAQGSPLGVIAGTDFAGGRPDQLVGLTYRPSSHASIFAVAHFEAETPSFNARGMLRAKIADRFHALFLLGTEVMFEHDTAPTRDFSTKLSLSTGLGLSYQPTDRISTWIAVDYLPPPQIRKRARWALGIVVWLID